MNFILEYKSFYNIGDIVYIQYWYNKDITPVQLKKRQGIYYLVSHLVEKSKIQNAPDELIKTSKIISKL